MSYLAELLRYRYFLVHLALSDLRARFRRSRLGLVWIPLYPLLLTLIIAGVMNVVFKENFVTFAGYVLSGLIAWDYLTSCINFGATSFLSAEGYVKQVRLPMAIYPIKAALYSLIIFGLALTGFVAFALVWQPHIFSLYWLYLPVIALALAYIGTPLAIISAVINIKFRDYQQLIGVVLQMIWYTSPVFLPRHIFDHPLLRDWTAINPVTAMLDILREPLINAAPPPEQAIGILMLWGLVFWGLAILMLRRHERRIVFYY